MKRITTLFLILGVILIFFGCATTQVKQEISAETEKITETQTWTWEGLFDPNEFNRWVEISQMTEGFTPFGFLYWSIIQNPDPNHTVQKVALLIRSKGGILLGYRCFNQGEPYGVFLDPETDHYAEYKYTQEERNACAECHTNLGQGRSI